MPMPMPTTSLTADQVARVARIYHCNADAASALGITGRSLARLCRAFGIETPYARARRQRQAAARREATA